MKLELFERAFVPIPEFYFPTDEEADLYCRMRDEYARRYRKEPFANRYSVALAVGSLAFQIPIPVLRQPRDRTNVRLVEDRQKLMAFCRVVSCVHPNRPNTWKGIAHVFNRKHPCVINAAHKFGAKIAAAMESNR